METEILNLKELAAKLDVHPATIRKLYREKTIPAMKLGYRTLRFDARKVYEALAKTDTEQPA